MTRRPPLFPLGLLALLPACGHRADPLPPLRKTPPAPAEFRLAQRGEGLELAANAPAVSVDGASYRELALEFLYAQGQADLEKAGQSLLVRAAPGTRVDRTLPLPAPGSLLRAAVRAIAGGEKGPRTLTKTLVVQKPLEAPRELQAALAGDGVGLTWQGVPPTAVPPPPLPVKPFSSGATGSARPSTPSAAPAAPVVKPAAPAVTPAAPAVTPAAPVTKGEPVPAPTGGAPPEPAKAAAPSGGAATGTPQASTSAAKTEAAPAPRTNGFFVYRRTRDAAYGAPLGEAPLEIKDLKDTSAPLGVTVCYVVRAVGSVDPLIESAPSNEVCLEPRDITPPATPAGLAVLPRGGGLELLWSPSSEEDLAGYRVYRSAGGAAPARLAELPAEKTSYLDQAVQPGARYAYTISAFDKAGNESPPSDPVEAALP